MSTNVKSEKQREQRSAENDRGSEMGRVAADKLQSYGTHYVSDPARDLGTILRDYAHNKPDVAAMWCFGFGLILGWKLRG